MSKMPSFKQFLSSLAEGDVLTPIKKNMVWKSTVAAGKKPRTELGTIGISIGQTQSTGDTSKPKLEAIGFRMGPGHQADVNTSQNSHSVPEPEIRVKEILRKIHASEFSIKEEQRIIEFLDTKPPLSVLRRKDIDELAVQTNIDPKRLHDLLGV